MFLEQMGIATLVLASLVAVLWTSEASSLDLHKHVNCDKRCVDLKTLASVLLAYNFPSVGRLASAQNLRDTLHQGGSHFVEQMRRNRRVGSALLFGSGKVLPPIGPLCPFRSSKFSPESQLGQSMENFMVDMPEISRQMEKFGQDISTGQMPDRELCTSLSEKLLKQVDAWEVAQTRMSLTGDFQTAEMRKVSEAWLKRNDERIEDMPAMMRWQAKCMEAFGTGLPPPPPPPNVDFAKMQALMQRVQQNGGAPSVIQNWGSAPPVTEQPFLLEDMKSDTVREEFQALVKDHIELIGMGESYGTFDPYGKIAFLDALDAVEDRWDVFITRFELMGSINQKFVDQSTKFLAAMTLTPESYREVVNEAHQLMRDAAEKEARAR